MGIPTSAGLALRISFTFKASDEFEEQLEAHLAELIEKRITEAGEARAGHEPTVTWHSGSPYRGLSVFDREHGSIFFGRTQAIGQAMTHFSAQVKAGRPFLMITGMSGSGKSSLVNAGLLPLIETPRVVRYDVGHVETLRLRPGQCVSDQGPVAGLCRVLVEGLNHNHDLDLSPEVLEEQLRQSPKSLQHSLAQVNQALARRHELHEKVSSRLLIVLDQCEELFTQKAFTPEQQSAFCDALEAFSQTGEIWLLATLRSDFIAAAEGTALIDLMREQGQYSLQPPKPHEIEQMIVQPAQAAGFGFERNDEGQRLDTVLREACAHQPGALPLLEFCLDELFTHRDSERGLFTFKAYGDIGRLAGAMSQRAEQALEQLEPQGIDVNAVLPVVFHALTRLHRFAVPDRGYSVFSCANSLFYREAAVEAPL